MDGDKCWLFLLREEYIPHSALLKVALEKLMRNCGWQGAPANCFQVPSTCVVPVLEPKKRKDYFFSNRFLRRRELDGWKHNRTVDRVRL